MKNFDQYIYLKQQRMTSYCCKVNKCSFARFARGVRRVSRVTTYRWPAMSFAR